MDSHDTISEVNEVKIKSEQSFQVKVCIEPGENITPTCNEDHRLIETTAAEIQKHNHATAQPEKSVPATRTVSCLGGLANFVLICPLVVIYWNTTWSLFDHILLSHSCRRSAWASAAIGFPVMAAATFFQDSLANCSSKCGWLVQIVVMRAYTYLVSVAVVSQWRSIWMLAHCYIGRSLLTSGLSFLAASLALILMRCLVSVAAPPVSISMDVSQVDYYKIPTFWGNKRFVGPTRATRRLLDTVITVFVVQVAVSTYWRALWAVQDLALLPHNLLVSALCSVGIGVGASCVLLALHKPIKTLHRYLNSRHWVLMLICQDGVTLLYSTVSVTIWRGVWTLVNLYLPFRPNSLYIAHVVSFTILAVCMASNSLLVRHIGRDGGGGGGLMFDARYVSTLVHTCRQKTGGSSGASHNINITPPESEHTEKTI